MKIKKEPAARYAVVFENLSKMEVIWSEKFPETFLERLGDSLGTLRRSALTPHPGYGMYVCHGCVETVRPAKKSQAREHSLICTGKGKRLL